MNTASVEVVSRGRRFQMPAMETEEQRRTIGIIPLQKSSPENLEVVYSAKAAATEPLEDCMMRCARQWLARRAK